MSRPTVRHMEGVSGEVMMERVRVRKMSWDGLEKVAPGMERGMLDAASLSQLLMSQHCQDQPVLVTNPSANTSLSRSYPCYHLGINRGSRKHLTTKWVRNVLQKHKIPTPRRKSSNLQSWSQCPLRMNTWPKMCTEAETVHSRTRKCLMWTVTNNPQRLVSLNEEKKN